MLKPTVRPGKEILSRIFTFIILEVFILTQPTFMACASEKRDDAHVVITNEGVSDDFNSIIDSNNKLNVSTKKNPGQEERRESIVAGPKETIEGNNVRISKDKSVIIKYRDVELEIPAGSVKEETNIIIEELDEVDNLNPGMENVTDKTAGYRFLPDGMKFEKNIKVTLPYNRNAVNNEEDLLNIFTYFYDEENLVWEKLQRIGIDKDKGLITSLTNHFTDMINSTLKLPESPKPLSFNPTSIKDIKSANPGTGMALIETPAANNEGSANLSYPITIPPGRLGLAPEISISYNSDGGNGWLGLGWGISESKISIDTRWGVPRYDAEYETETYLFNGMQLTPMTHRGEKVDRKSETEKRFYPRMEGGFNRIIRHGDSPDSYWWEVTDKSGCKYYYGGLPGKDMIGGSVLNIESGGGNGNIFSWALVRVMDVHGNTIDYTYDKVSDSGTGEGTDGVMGVNLYLREIRYTGTEDAKGKYSVYFVRDRDLEEERRSDVSINAKAGFKVVTADLLRKIEVGFEEAGGIITKIRSYELVYQQGAFGKTLLNAIVQYGKNGEEFNRHEFAYYDDLKNGSKYNGFEYPVTWSGGSEDDVDGALLLSIAKPTSLDSSSSYDNGYNVRAGVTFQDVIGLLGKIGGNSGKSKSLVKFIDINGDGKPEPVFKKSSNIFYYPNEISVDNGILNFGAKKSINDLHSLGEESNNTFLWGVEGKVVIGASYTKVNIDKTCNAYFSDVNADGLIDFIKDRIVYFNRIDISTGRPVFSQDSSDTPAPMGNPDNINLDEILDFQNEVYNEQIKKIPLMDTVKCWEAPFEGTISIDAPVNLKNIDRSDESTDGIMKYETADGVTVSIQHNNNKLWSKEIDADNYNPIDPSSDCVDQISVNRGDKIYFRVQSNYDGAYDVVNWDPAINYVDENNNPLNPGLDMNGLNPYHFKASEDFVYAGMGNEIVAPLTGTIHVDNTFIKTGVTSDDVEIALYINGKKTESASALFDGGQISSYNIGWDASVKKRDLLEFKINLDSPIDLSKISWSPKLYYTSCVNSDDNKDIKLFDDNGNPTINLNGIYSADLYAPLNSPYDKSFEPDSPSANEVDTIHLFPSITLYKTSGKENYAGRVNFIIKKENELIYKKSIDINFNPNPAGQGDTSEVFSWGQYDIDYDDIESGKPLYVYVTCNDKNLAEKISDGILKINYHYDQIIATSDGPVHRTAAFNYYKPDEVFLFSKSYRGWRNFAYNGSIIDETTHDIGIKEIINQNELIVKEDSYSDGERQPNVFVLYPDITNGKWASEDDGCWISTYEMSSSRRGIDYIEMPSIEKLKGSRAVDIMTHSTSEATGFGVDIPVSRVSTAGLSCNLSNGNSSMRVSYCDMNGDGFPDILSRNKIQYTKADGTFEESNKDNLSGGINKTQEDTFNISIGSNISYQIGNNSDTFSQDNASVPELQTAGCGATKSIKNEKIELGLNIGFAAESSSETTYSLLDINGDGLPDKVSVEKGKVGDTMTDVLYTSLNLGYSFASREKWDVGCISNSEQEKLTLDGVFGYNIDDYDFAGGGSYCSTESTGKKLLADINGDGLLDIISKEETKIKVSFNTGSGFSVYYEWDGAINNDISKSNNTTIGEGLYFTIKIPLGFGFYFVFKAGGDHSDSIGEQEVSLSDINGDGFLDQVKSDEFGEIKVAYNNTGRTDKLKTIKRPLGAEITLDYKAMDTSYNMPRSKWVLSSVKVYDGHEGDGVDEYLTTYQYYGGYYDRLEREFYGFETIIAEQRNASNGLVLSVNKKTYSNDSFYNKGLLAYETVEDNRGYVYRENKYIYSLKKIDDEGTQTEYDIEEDPDKLTARVMPLLKQEDTYSYEKNTTSFLHTYNTFSYDAYGNVTEYYDYGDDNIMTDTVKAYIEYENNEDKNILSMPVDIKVYGNGELIRHKGGKYNEDTGDLVELSQFYKDNASAVTGIEYYDNGNVSKVTYPANYNGSRYYVSMIYDDAVDTYPVEVSDAGGYVSRSAYDLYFGSIMESTDINNNKMIYKYDDFGRAEKIYSPYDLDEAGNIYSDDICAVKFEYHHDQFPAFAVTKNKIHFDRTDAETLDTVIAIDGLGRVIQTKKEGEIVPLDTSGFYSQAGHSGNTFEKQYGMNVSGVAVYDSMGRVVQQGQPLFQTGTTEELYAYWPGAELKNEITNTYDDMGRVTKIELPYDRSKPDTASVIKTFFTIENGYFKTRVIDPMDNEKISYTDIRSNTVRIEQFNKGKKITTRYQYSLLNEITKVTDTEGNATTITYDMLGRRTSINNPDSGEVRYTYDPAGNLIEKIDPNTSKMIHGIIYQYDNLNRLENIKYPQSAQISYEYGTPSENNLAGRIKKVTDDSGTTEYEYGKLGEQTGVIKTMISKKINTDDIILTEEYLFDYLGRIESMKYPSEGPGDEGERVYYVYDRGGQVAGVYGKHREEDFTYIKDIGYDEYGQRVYMEYGHGVKTTYTYDPYRRWLANIDTRYGDRVFQDMDYTFDKMGNILKTENKGYKQAVQNYGYDDLYQLVHADGFYKNTLDPYKRTTGYTQDFVYDDIGNMTSKKSTRRVKPVNNNKMLLNYEYTYTYDNDSSHRAVTIGDWKYTYDDNGNVVRIANNSDNNDGETEGQLSGGNYGETDGNLSDPDNNNGETDGMLSHPTGTDGSGTKNTERDDEYLWNEENRMVEAKQNGESTFFVYNAGGERTIKLNNENETLYVSKFFQVQNREVITKHIFVGDIRIVSKLSYMKQTPASSQDTGYERENQFYYHPDHIGSTSFVTCRDSKNNTVMEYEHYEYTPYGETWVEEHTDTFKKIDHKFNSKELDKETGMYYYGARYLDPKTSRWMSVDPIYDGVERGGSIYGYCRNSPVMYVDPTGLWTFQIGVTASGFISVGGAYSKGYIFGRSHKQDFRTGTYKTDGLGVSSSMTGGLTIDFIWSSNDKIEDVGGKSFSIATSLKAGGAIAYSYSTPSKPKLSGTHKISIGIGATFALYVAPVDVQFLAEETTVNVDPVIIAKESKPVTYAAFKEFETAMNRTNQDINSADKFVWTNQKEFHEMHNKLENNKNEYLKYLGVKELANLHLKFK